MPLDCGNMMIVIKVLKLLDTMLERISLYLLLLSVMAMLLISIVTIVLRWYGISYSQTEPLVRHLVFLSAFLGGVLATGRGAHISIDIVGKYIKRGSKTNKVAAGLLGAFVSLVSFLTLVWLTKASIDFTLIEMKYGKEQFFSIHSGYLVAIIPVGLSLIAYRFLYQFVMYCNYCNYTNRDSLEGLIC